MTELQILQVTEFMEKYKKNWKEHVYRTSSDRIPKKDTKISTKKKKKFGKPWK
jgi:hypothetical protein